MHNSNQFQFSSDEAKEGMLQKLNALLNQRPNTVLEIYNIIPSSMEQCHLHVYVDEKSMRSNQKVRVGAIRLSNFLRLEGKRATLVGMGVADVVPMIKPTPDQWYEYYDTTPLGFEDWEWKKAQNQNPDPENMFPVPVYGFTDLNARVRIQEREIKLQWGNLNRIKGKWTKIVQYQTALPKILQTLKNKFDSFRWKILHMLGKLYTMRRLGPCNEQNEEDAKFKIEQMLRVIENMSLQTRIKEIEAKITRLRANQTAIKRTLNSGGWVNCKAAISKMINSHNSTGFSEDVRTYFAEFHDGFDCLSTLIKNDLKELNILHELQQQQLADKGS